MKTFNILPECHVDTRLTEILGRVTCAGHKHGKGNVARELETVLSNSIALGIVDEDKKKGPEPKYFANNFIEISKEHNLLLKRHSSIKHFIIVIFPEIESWLTENVSLVNVSPADYNLPENFTGFIKLCKSQNIRKNYQFDNFIKALINKKAPGILLLKAWLEGFLENQDLP